jgi:hypothetical protein
MLGRPFWVDTSFRPSCRILLTRSEFVMLALFRGTIAYVSRTFHMALLMLGLVSSCCLPWTSNAHAQSKYEEVLCSAVPVTGFDFKWCWQSDIWATSNQLLHFVSPHRDYDRQ